MAAEGGSAREKAETLRRLAAEARDKADRMDSMAERWEAGELGERRVAEVLAPLLGQSCRVLHDRLLAPGQSRVNLDHIVVSVAGTYLIDAKNFSGAVVAERGGLRLRDGNRRRLDDKVDKVRRMAELMESITTSVIEPVICLAGASAAEFGPPISVRGVFVVPLDHLVPWLLSRPRESAGNDLDARTARLAAAFPSATEYRVQGIAPMLDRRRLRPTPGVRVLPPSRSVPPRGSRPLPPRGARRPARAGTPRHATAIKALLSLSLALILLTATGQRLWMAGITGGAELSTRQLDKTVQPAAPAVWVPPCTGLSDSAVASAVGRPVYRYVNGPHDTCTWGLVPRPSSTAPGTLRIATGWEAQHSAYPTGPAARLTSTATSAVLTVPQFADVLGSAAAAASITQPMLLVLTWKGTPVTQAHAELAVTLLVRDLARQLPAGPSATTIVRR